MSDDDLRAVDGVGESYADQLRDAGIDSLDALAAADADAVADAADVARDRAEDWIAQADEMAGEASVEADGGEAVEADADDADDSDADDAGDGAETDDSGGDPTIIDIRNGVEEIAEGIIGRPLDGITEVRPEDDGWLVVVEVIERSAVPDTQDILGEYELELNANAQVRGYRRVDRYRRSDTA